MKNKAPIVGRCSSCLSFSGVVYSWGLLIVIVMFGIRRGPHEAKASSRVEDGPKFHRLGQAGFRQLCVNRMSNAKVLRDALKAMSGKRSCLGFS